MLDPYPTFWPFCAFGPISCHWPWYKSTPDLVIMYIMYTVYMVYIVYIMYIHCVEFECIIREKNHQGKRTTKGKEPPMGKEPRRGKSNQMKQKHQGKRATKGKEPPRETSHQGENSPNRRGANVWTKPFAKQLATQNQFFESSKTNKS